MHQTKKGNQWHFGMKAHIGVDAQSGLVHTVLGTAANVADITQAGALLHGEEDDAFGDAGYRGVHQARRSASPRWHVAMQPGKRRRLDLSHEWARLLEQAEQLKASVRAKVEHPFHVIKNLFRHKKVRYKGLAKNQAQLFKSVPRDHCWPSMPEVPLEHGKWLGKGPKTLQTDPSRAQRTNFATHFALCTSRAPRQRS
jgi:IS5 family transposase